MSCIRVLVLSLLTLLATIWLIANLEGVERYVGFRPLSSGPVALTAFDFRLHPEKHTQRATKVIELNWLVQSELRSPDGIQKSIYTVNGLFPGPTIEARSGDRIVLRVHNGLQEETTAIHFHGIRHIGSNSMDGTPGLTQCAIQPNHSFLYNFTIKDNQSGTYWWHSHSLSQRADGLFGAFVVHDPVDLERESEWAEPSRIKDDLRIRYRRPEEKRDKAIPETVSIPERIVLVGDWYHLNSAALLQWYRSKKSYGYEPTPDTALLNGLNTFNCSRANRFVHCDHSLGQNPSLSLDVHFKTRVRFVNTGSLADLEISLDSHTLIVIEADGSPIAPQRVNSLTISPGQRYSVIPEPHTPHPPRAGDTFWLRVLLDEEPFNMPNAALDSEQFFLVFYGDSSSLYNTRPTGPFAPYPGLEDFNALSLLPLHQSSLPQADQQITIYVSSVKLDERGGAPYGFMNRTSWEPDERQPLLLREANDNNVTDWGKHQLVVTTHRAAPSVVELIINNVDDGPHPLHLHGHYFYPLHVHKSSYGWGKYNYSAPPLIPNEAPVLRDTLVVPRRGHAVIRFLADAPGMWLFHCHMMVHLSTGMAMTFNVRPDLVSQEEKELVRERCDLQSLER